MAQKTEFACKNCKRKLEYYKSDYRELARDYYYFDELIYTYKYQGVIRSLLLGFKFSSKNYLYSFLAEDLKICIKDYCMQKGDTIDYIIYVPISYRRYLERGYNQSYLLAKPISKYLDVPIIKYCLIKVKHNKKQSELKHNQRMSNIKDVYKITYKSIIKDKTILLIDDIYTTGATVNECAKVLKRSGAKKVIVAVCARA